MEFLEYIVVTPHRSVLLGRELESNDWETPLYPMILYRASYNISYNISVIRSYPQPPPKDWENRLNMRIAAYQPVVSRVIRRDTWSVTLIRILTVHDHEIVRMGVRNLLSKNSLFEVCGEA